MPNASHPDSGPSVNVRVLTEVWEGHGLAHLLVRSVEGRLGYRAQCNCGAIGPRCADAGLAQRSWLRHVVGVALQVEQLSPGGARLAARSSPP